MRPYNCAFQCHCNTGGQGHNSKFKIRDSREWGADAKPLRRARKLRPSGLRRVSSVELKGKGNKRSADGPGLDRMRRQPTPTCL